MANAQTAPAPHRDAIPCPNCGYDLRGVTSDVCSECGKRVDVARLTGIADVP